MIYYQVKITQLRWNISFQNEACVEHYSFSIRNLLSNVKTMDWAVVDIFKAQKRFLLVCKTGDKE